MRLFLKKNRNQVIFQFGTQNFQCFGDVELHTFDGNAELFRYLFVRSILITAQYKNLPALVRHTFQCFLYDMLYFRIKDRIRFAGFQCRDSQVQFPLAMAIYLFFGPKTHLQMCQIVERRLESSSHLSLFSHRVIIDSINISSASCLSLI